MRLREKSSPPLYRTYTYRRLPTTGTHNTNSLLKQFTNFTNSASGLERILRFLQALCQILAEASVTSQPSSSHAIRYSIARTKFALGRRYLRFFKFIDCFQRAGLSLSFMLFVSSPVSSSTSSLSPFTSATHAPAPTTPNCSSTDVNESPAAGGGNERRVTERKMRQAGTAVKSIEFGKWSCLGIYFFLEALTTPDAMGLWTLTPSTSSPSWLSVWSKAILMEANRFWFYALTLSLIGSLLEIFLLFPSLYYPMDTNNVNDNIETNAGKPSEAGAKSGTEAKISEKDVLVSASEPSPLSIKTSQRKTINPFISHIKSIVVDACDILIPGSFLSWIPTTIVGPVQVGVATMISTAVTARDVWILVNYPQ